VRSSTASSSSRHQTTIEGLTGRIREASAAEDFGPERVQAVLAAALATDADWLEARYQQQRAQNWMLHSLYRVEDGRVSMLAAVFKPGVVSPLHNHGTWAVIGVYRGRERETRYRKINDATTPGSTRLEVEHTLVNPQGSVTVVPDGTIHSVEALDGHGAVGIHVNGTDIVTQPRSTFELTTGAESLYQPDFAQPEHQR
jgi:predicted metal-dependent enzyme (double-stranded beta helix superfamily)